MREIVLDSCSLREILAEIFRSGRAFSFRGHGSSMYPFIRDGDTLTIAPLAGRQPRIGEVVAYTCPIEKRLKLVVHRVVGRQGTSFIVQGDGNRCAPELVPSEDVLGRLARIERDGRYVRRGFGPERRLIAWLTRTRLLWSIFWPVWRRFRQLPMRKGFGSPSPLKLPLAARTTAALQPVQSSEPSSCDQNPTARPDLI